MRLVVVGAGVVGAACAHAASKLGADVISVDAGLPGQATAAGAGIICPWSDSAKDLARYDLACASARAYPALADELADAGQADVSYRRVGALYLADDEKLEGARDGLLARRSAAPEIGDVEILSSGEARGMFPPLRDGTAAVYIGGAARVDGRRLASALIGAASANGAVTLTGRADLAVSSGRVTGVVVDGNSVGADAVVAAAGAWTESFTGPAGVTVRVCPQRGQIAHFGVAAADTATWPVILPSGSGHYLLAFDDSRVVAGATREEGSGFDYRLTAAGLHEVLGQALAVAPGLGAATYLEARVGFRPVGPDGLPLLGPVAGVEGLVIATGLGATGLTMGPLAGAIAARVALGLDPDADLAPFDPLR